VDLFGEQFVQVMTALLHSTIVMMTVVCGAVLVWLLSVRVAQGRQMLPVRARVRQPLAGIIRPARAAAPMSETLATCLPSRAPPDLFHRPCPSRQLPDGDHNLVDRQ
jgi:hypothetical protein